MWSDSPYTVPRPSFPRPVLPIDVEPDVGPCICVSFNAAYQPYILGALQQLAQDCTWRLGVDDDIAVVQGRINRLMEMFGVSEGCSTLPPVGPGGTTDQTDCNIAVYLVNEVVKEAMQIAINKATGVGPAWSILTYILDTIPFAGDVIGLVGTGIEGSIEAMILYSGLGWVEGQADDALWSAIGCQVYAGVHSIHGFTDASLASIVTNIRGIGGPFSFTANAVADFLEGLGSAALNTITSVSDLKNYDCSACASGPVAPTTNTGTTIQPHILEVTDGTNDFVGVKELTFSGATATGTPANVTIAGLAGAKGATGAAGATGATGAAGATGAVGAAGPIGPGWAAPANGQAYPSDLSGKGLNLWNSGAGTNDAPPAGWEAITFDDGAWPSVVAAPTVGSIPGCAIIWAPPLTTWSPTCQALVRQNVTLPAQLASSANLHVYANGTPILAVAINGTEVYSAAYPYGPGVDVDADVLSLIQMGEDNVIAVWAENYNGSPETSISASIAFILTINEIGTTGATGGAGATGATGATGAPGATGATGADGASVGPGTATEYATIADVPLATAAWSVLWDATPAAGTYQVGGTVDVENTTATEQTVAVRVRTDSTVVAGAEAGISASDSHSITTPRVVVTLDGTQHLYLEAFAPLTGFTALASTLQGSAAPTTVLYAAQAGGSGTTLAHYEVYLATDYTLTTAGTPYAVLTYTPAAGVWHVTAAAQCP